MKNRLLPWLTSLLLIATFSVAHPHKAAAQYQWILGGTGTASCVVPLPNDTSTGTFVNNLVKPTSSAKVINLSTSDTTRIAGVVVANAGTTGSASVQVCGVALINFDSGVTAGDFVIASTSVGGDARDAGSNSPSATVQSIGQVVSPTTAGAGQYLVLLELPIYPTGGGGGGGTVTSVSLTMPTGFAVAGSPLTSSGTLAVTFSTESPNVVLAGPVSGSAATPTFRLLGAYDVPGNVIRIPNAASTGTTLNKLVQFNTHNPVQALLTTGSQTTGIKGVCIQGCGTSGTAVIQQSGQTPCIFSAGTTANDFVQQSATAGLCIDAGATYPTSGGEVIGIVESTNASSGTYTIDLFSPDVVSTSGTGVACASLPALTGDVTTSAGSCATTVGGVQGNSLAPNRVTTSSATLSVSLCTSLNQFITLHDTITSLAFSCAPADGNIVRFKLTQNNGGSHTVTWPGTVQWPGATSPVLTTTNGQADFIQCLYDATTTNYDCSSVLNFTP